MNIFQAEKGAVSIFLILIITFIFMFHAVLIDYARVMAANKQTEIALKAAVRSALSSYNTQLQEDYGVFGVSEADANEIFIDILEKNLYRSDGYFQLINPRITGHFFQMERSLAHHQMFKQQILEEMKYKAPIEFTIEVIDRFKPMASAMKEASKTTNLLKELHKLNSKREKHLDTILMKQKDAFELASQKKHKYFESEESFFITNHFGSYVSDYYSLRHETDSIGRMRIQANIHSYLNQSRTILDELRYSLDELIRKLDDALIELDAAKELNERIKDRINKARDDNQLQQYDRVKEYSNHSSPTNTGLENNEDYAAINSVNESVDQLVYSEDIFSELKVRISEQKKLAEQLQSSIYLFRSQFETSIQLSEDESDTQKEKELMNKHRRLIQVYDHYIAQAQKIVENNTSIIQGKKPDPQDKALRKQKEEESKQSLSEILEIYNKIKQLQSKADDYNQVGEHYKKYREFNHQIERLEEILTKHEDPEDAADEAMSVMNKMFDGIADLLTNSRDRIYINEYAFYNFKSFDPRLLKDINKLSDVSQLEQLMDIRNQEIEYILYGFETPGANLGAAFGEIFAMRMAINTMEAFKTCAGTGTPLTVLFCVLAKALYETLNDINNLFNGEPIQFASFAQGIKLTYQDHLRLFMLLHGGDNRLSRMQALIHFKTDIDLNDSLTYATGSTSTAVNLWFIPGVMKALSYAGIIDGEIEGKEYRITKTAVWAY